MDRNTFLMNRKKGIGGSDVAAVLGLSRWKTPLDVFIEKTRPHDDNAPDIDSPAMRAGRELEAVVAKYYEEETGMKLVRRSHTMKSREYEFLIANVDRVILRSKDRPTGILEAKTANQYAVKDWDGSVPMQYMLQLQHYLYVAGLEWGSLAVLIGGQTFKYVDVERDRKLNDMVNEKLVRFWTENVMKNVPPEPICERDISTLVLATTPGKSIIADSSTYEAYAELKNLEMTAKNMEILINEKKEFLKLKMMDAETIVDSLGSPLITWKFSKPSSIFNTKAFKAENPELAEKFMEEKQGSRRFLLK